MLKKEVYVRRLIDIIYYTRKLIIQANCNDRTAE